jgi:hypothetical protein
MYNFFPKGVSVITVVVLGMKGNKVEVVQRFRLAKSQVDMAKFPARADGSPVWGARVYRERTKAEVKAAGLTDAPYLATLVPLVNTGDKPWIDPASLLPQAAVAA